MRVDALLNVCMLAVVRAILSLTGKALATPHESSTMRKMHLGAHSSSATPELCICNGKDEVTEIFEVKDCFDVQDIPADTQFNVEPSSARRSHRMHCSPVARTTHPMRQRVTF